MAIHRERKTDNFTVCLPSFHNFKMAVRVFTGSRSEPPRNAGYLPSKIRFQQKIVQNMKKIILTLHCSDGIFFN